MKLPNIWEKNKIDDWKDIVSWVKDYNATLSETLKGVTHATAYFLRKESNDTVTLSHKLYYSESNQWLEHVTIKTFDFNLLPEWAKGKVTEAGVTEVDVTEEIEAEL